MISTCNQFPEKCIGFEFDKYINFPYSLVAIERFLCSMNSLWFQLSFILLGSDIFFR